MEWTGWTLVWEVLCYLAAAGLGLAELANRRWLPVGVLALGIIAAILLPPLSYPGPWTNTQLAIRFAIIFSAGAAMYLWRDVIPARWSLVALSVLAVAASSLLSDYRLVGALPLAYAIIVSSLLLQHERLRLRTDLSYGT